MILLVDNLSNFFYECTLVMSWTTNANIYLRFQIFNALFNYFEQIEKNIRRSTCLLSAVIIKTCKKVSIKLAKYYVKIENSNEIIYNLANILNSTMKLNLYKIFFYFFIKCMQSMTMTLSRHTYTATAIYWSIWYIKSIDKL